VALKEVEMRIRAGVAALTLLALASGAEAGVFGFLGGGPSKFPQAVDSPRVRPKVEESHKFGARFKAHKGKLQSPEWGADWKRMKRRQRAPQGHYLFD
jgi:hypothetical protein